MLRYWPKEVYKKLYWVLLNVVTWKLCISVGSLLLPPCLLELEDTKDHVPQFPPQKVASSGGGGPRALQHRLNQDSSTSQHVWSKNNQTLHQIQFTVCANNKTHLVIVPICYCIGLNSCLLHLKQHPDSQDRLAVLTTQLQQNTVTHLGQNHTKLFVLPFASLNGAASCI